MKFKVGDVLVCKKSLKDHIYYAEEGKSYRITEILNLLCGFGKPIDLYFSDRVAKLNKLNHIS